MGVQSFEALVEEMCGVGNITHKRQYRWPWKNPPKKLQKWRLWKCIDNYWLRFTKKKRQEVCLKFAKSVINNGKLNDLFPVNDKTYRMKTREDEKFKVQFANTGRLKQSSILTMQNIVSNNDKKTEKSWYPFHYILIRPS